MSDPDAVAREYRENNKNYIEYEGHRYRYSNPLKSKKGKNWKCVTTKCIATLKSEIDSSGNTVYTTRYAHDHSPPIIVPKRKSAVEKRDSTSSHSSSTSSSSKSSSSFRISINGGGGLNSVNSGRSYNMPDLREKLISQTTNNQAPISSSSWDTKFTVTPQITTHRDRSLLSQGNEISILPCNQSVLSVGTPAVISSLTDSTFSGTPLLQPTAAELRKQVDALVQEIIRKELTIEKLQRKSDEDDQVIKDMLQSIKVLEGAKISCADNTVKTSFRQIVPEIIPIPPEPQAARQPLRSSTAAKNIRILGDSHARNLKELLSKELPSTYNVHVNFKPGGTYQDVVNLASSSDPPADHVFVLAGANDVCRSDWISVENAIYDLTAKFETSQIHLVLTLNRASSPSFNKYINIFNKHVKHLTRKLHNVSYVDTHFLFRYSDYTHDNLHLNRLGKIKLCRKIRQAIFPNQIKTHVNMNTTKVRFPFVNKTRGNHFEKKPTFRHAGQFRAGGDIRTSNYYGNNYCSCSNIRTQRIRTNYHSQPNRSSHLNTYYNPRFQNRFHWTPISSNGAPHSSNRVPSSGNLTGRHWSSKPRALYSVIPDTNHLTCSTFTSSSSRPQPNTHIFRQKRQRRQFTRRRTEGDSAGYKP